MSGPGSVQYPAQLATRKRRLAAPSRGAGAKGRVSLSVKEVREASERELTLAHGTSDEHIGSGRVIAETLALVGLAAGVLGRSGQLIAANKLFEEFVPGTIREIKGRLRLVDPIADSMINDIVMKVVSTSGGGAHAIPVRGRHGRPPTLLHLFSIPQSADDDFARIGAVLIATMPQPRSAPSLETLRGLFDLSPAEARVAQGIATRLTVETIADRSGVSRETVRSQLKTVLAKTGTKRQLDLALLLQALPQPQI